MGLLQKAFAVFVCIAVAWSVCLAECTLPMTAYAASGSGIAAGSSQQLSGQASKAKLNKTKASVKVGKTVKLKVSNAGKKKVTWTSSKKKIAKVSSSGVVTGVKAGKATVTAKVGKVKLKCVVTVSKPVLSASLTSVTLKQQATAIGDGYNTVLKNPTGKVRITFTKKNYNVSCSSSSSAVNATWEGKWSGNKTNLILEGVHPGTATVTVSNDYNKETVKVKVTVKAAFDVEVEPSYSTMSHVAKTRSGTRVTEYFLPIYVTNNSSLPLSITSAAALYAPDKDNLDSTLNLMLFDGLTNTWDTSGSSEATGLYSIANHMIGESTPVNIAPGKKATVYAYVGTRDMSVSRSCAIVSNITLGGTDYFVVSDYWGAVYTWK